MTKAKSEEGIASSTPNKRNRRQAAKTLGARGYGAPAAADAIACDEADYEAHRFALGVPGHGDWGVEKTYPIEANFDLLNGIDFKKGCFVGQETTSRMKRRGVIKTTWSPSPSTDPRRSPARSYWQAPCAPAKSTPQVQEGPWLVYGWIAWSPGLRPWSMAGRGGPSGRSGWNGTDPLPARTSGLLRVRLRTRRENFQLGG